MKDIDKIIRENRLDFDIYEPNEGHFERFEQKLLDFNKKDKAFSVGYLLKIASVIILIILSGLWIFDNIHFNNNQKSIALKDLSQEYNEVELYYTQLVNQRYSEIKQFHFIDSSQKIILMKELMDMDSIYENLKRDLTINPYDERVINAMIQHYKLKVEVMNQILQQLQQVKNINKQKSENYESTTI